MLLPTRWRRDDARVSKVSVLLGGLVVLVLVAFAAGCGSDSDQGQARQEATKNIEAKGQQARQTLKKKQLSWMSRGKVLRRPPRGTVF
jgi:hypothetical protein